MLDFINYDGLRSIGPYAAFTSNLVAGDTNDQPDVFVRDTVTGVTSRVSLGQGGAQANDKQGRRPAFSWGGRFVAFASRASNLVAGDTNMIYDVVRADPVVTR